MLLIDRATDYRDAYPASAKSSPEVVKALQHFLGSSFAGKFICDNSKEFKSACDLLSISIDPTIPYRPQSNAITERAIGVLTDAAKTALNQSGLLHKFWPFAVKYVCFIRNQQPCELNGGVTPWFSRTGSHSTGPLIPFGSLVQLMPPKEAKLRLKFDSNLQTGIYLGPNIGLDAKWAGNSCVVSVSDFENGYDNPRVFRVKEIKHVGETFTFPISVAVDLNLPKRIALGFGLDTPREARPEEPNTEDAAVPVGPSASKSLADHLKKGGRPRVVGLGGTPPGVLYELYKPLSIQGKRECWDKYYADHAAAEITPLASEPSSSSSGSAAAAVKPSRCLLEFCCSENSELGAQAPSLGWDFERYHLSFGDLRTSDGLEKALAVAKAKSLICALHLHGSLPCTPWAGWQRRHIHHMGNESLKAYS